MSERKSDPTPEEIAKVSGEIRSGWDARTTADRMRDAEAVLAAGMLKRVHQDFEALNKTWEACLTALAQMDPLKRSLAEFKAAAREFAKIRSICQKHVNWLYNPPVDGIPIEDLAAAVSRDADVLREKYFEGLPVPLTRIVTRGKGYICPFCGGKR